MVVSTWLRQFAQLPKLRFNAQPMAAKWKMKNGK
jgi:hypothetical protein